MKAKELCELLDSELQLTTQSGDTVTTEFHRVYIKMKAQEMCELLDSIATEHKSCPAFNVPWEKCEFSPFGAEMKDFAQTESKWREGVKHKCRYLLRVFFKDGDAPMEVEKCYLCLNDAKTVALDVSRRTNLDPTIDLIVLDGWGDIKAVESLCYVQDGCIQTA